MASISLRGVSKTFAAGTAVHDVSLDVADGELLVVLGPSGSGKSTVLRLIAGLEEPTSGEIHVGGRDITHEPPQARDLAMVFQNYALYPHKTVRENLEFGLRVRRVDPAQVRERVDRTARLLGIDALLGRKPSELSGGQRQRVALGRALVREPQAFLLDEPLSNLDPVLRAATRAELAQLHRRLGTTMVYVTHDQEEAMTLGSRIAVMRDGRLEQLDTPLEIFRRPANVFVARFVGTPAMNIWRDGERDLGIRPQDVELTTAGGGDLEGSIEVVERLGASTVVHVQTGAPIVELLRVVAAGDYTAAVGDRVGLRLRRDRLHAFDVATGRLRPAPTSLL
jgi:multiple sugar transport system ATP-binding protein